MVIDVSFIAQLLKQEKTRLDVRITERVQRLKCGVIARKPGEGMIGNNGDKDGNIKKMRLKINNGKKTATNYLVRMVMGGGGSK